MKKILFVLLAVILVACRKDVKINNNLWKGGGDWNINNYYYQYGDASSPFGVSNGVHDNCGSFKFSKDGTGTMTITLDGETEAQAFKYSNTENKLTLVYDGTFAKEYDLTWNKDVITIKYNNDGNNTFDNETFILMKK